MGTFTDKTGRDWLVEIDIVNVKRVKEALGVNLLELVQEGSELPMRLGDPTDPVLLVDTLYVICQDQANARDVDDVAFGRCLSADSISDALDAVMEGVVDFFPRQIRPAYRKVLETTRRVRDLQADKIATALADPEFEEQLNAKVDEMLGPKTPGEPPTSGTSDASSLPESSASIPGDTPPVV